MCSSNLLECKKIRILLSSYIDDELDKEQTKMVRLHLTSCTDCNKEYHGLLKIRGIIRHLQEIQVDYDIPENIFKRIDAARRLPETLWFPVTIRVALVLAIIVNIGILSLFRNYKQEAPKFSAYKPIKVENIILEKEQNVIEVSFSSPAEDTIEKFIPPKVKNFEKPTYPESFCAKNIQGTVILNIGVSAGGKVENIKMAKSLSSEADSLALISANAMKFFPAKVGTLNVNSNIMVTFVFKVSFSY